MPREDTMPERFLIVDDDADSTFLARRNLQLVGQEQGWLLPPQTGDGELAHRVGVWPAAKVLLHCLIQVDSCNS